MHNSDLKNNAKKELTGTYWMAFLLSLIFSIIVVACNTIISTIQYAGVDYSKAIEYAAEGKLEKAQAMLQQDDPVVSTVVSLLSIAIAVFLINILRVGHNKAYIHNRYNKEIKIELLFEPFKHYFNTMKTMFFRDLYVALWSLLFVIPGIVKSYSYYMIPYIIAENPNISTSRAFEISKKTMNGEKGKAFYMHLSFIGWYLLSLLTCGIGAYFLTPYTQATFTEFYEYTKSKAISTGIASPEEFEAA